MKDLDEIYSDTWDRREQNLRGVSYADYLKSDHWAEVRRKASKRANYKKCEFCECTDVDLHHTSYKWIWTDQELRCIVALCRVHHQEVHDLAKASRLSVRLATNQLRKKYKETRNESMQSV